MNENISISKLDPKDNTSIEIIADWYYREWETPVEKTVRRLSSQPNEETLFQAILKSDGELIATGGLCNQVNILNVHPDLSKFGPWIALLYTATAHQNKGFGQQLLAFIEQSAKEMNFHKIYLYTFTAGAFYKKYGWTEMEKVWYKNQETVVMKKYI